MARGVRAKPWTPTLPGATVAASCSRSDAIVQGAQTMHRTLSAISLFVALALAPPVLAQRHSSGSHSRSSSSKSRSHSSSSRSRNHSARSTSSVHSYRKNYVAEGFTPHSSVTRDRHGRIKRSREAKDAFKREHPCPATGSSRGACRGYVIDHVKPLECGGADAPYNMQWQTAAAAKAKDKTERSCR